MENPMQRRKFLQSLALTPLLLSAKDSNANPAQPSQFSGYASLIDIDKCDGCQGFPTPKCVSACKDKNAPRFPKPITQIPDYFPRKGYEDYSQNQEDISRLTPYNWTFIENVKIDDKSVFIPRRCMHCDDPTCQKICPFGVIGKDNNNAVNIDEHFCFGGAKCRDVCPWGIPQRQAGVGIYLKLAPKLAGGGAMFKCDMCGDLLAKGEKSACEVACPKNAIVFAPKAQITALVESEKAKGRFVYGDVQNGGTSTFYLSSIPFTKIAEAIAEKYGKIPQEFNDKTQKMGRPHMNVEVKNFVNTDSTLVKSVLAAPIIGAIAGAIAVAKSKKGSNDES